MMLLLGNAAAHIDAGGKKSKGKHSFVEQAGQVCGHSRSLPELSWSLVRHTSDREYPDGGGASPRESFHSALRTGIQSGIRVRHEGEICIFDFVETSRRQTRFAHITALNAALVSAALYFLQCACFGYGAKLIDNGEITYSQLLR